MEKRNELPSFEIIYSDHSKMVFNLCLNYLKNEAVAEDLTQEVFVKIYHKMDTFHADAQLKTWIYRLTINTCLDFLRAQKSKKRFGFLFSLSRSQTEYDKALTEFNHPGVLLEHKERTAQVFKLIDQLPDRQKTALLLHVTEGLNLEEIAEIMSATPKAIESLLGRARVTLKKNRINEGNS